LSKESKKLTHQICISGFIILCGGLILAFLGAWNYIPVDPMIVVPVTLVLVIALGCAGSASMASGMSGISHKPFIIQPDTPDSSIWKRVVRDGPSGESYIITGTEKTTYKEALLNNWPFNKRDKNSKWHVDDDKGNDITYRFLSEIDCIADIVFY
jgi:hypothetical protein